MTKISKLMAGLMLGAALLTSSIVPAQAQQQFTYVTRTAFHITTATTTTVVSSDAYVASVVVNCSSLGTAFTAKVQNKEGTAKVLVANDTTPVVGNKAITVGGADRGAIYMKGGIDIVSSGTPGVIDVFVTYYKP